MPWRWTLDFATKVRCLAGRLFASLRAKRWTRSIPERVNNGDIKTNILRQVAMNTTAGPRILALSVLADADPVQIIGAYVANWTSNS